MSKFICLFLLLGLSARGTEPLSMVPLAEAVRCDLGNGSFGEIGLARLSYRDSHGELNETTDLYVIVYVNKRPTVIGYIAGHTPRLEASDVDGDGRSEILVYYHAGANQLALNIYRIGNRGFGAKRVLSVAPTLFSNLGDISVSNKKILVRNLIMKSENSATRTTEEFELRESELVSVSVVSEQVHK